MLNIKKIELELKVKLPEFFVEFHQHHQELIKTLRKLLNDEDYITLSTDANWIIEHNSQFLNLPNNKGFCRGKLCIGTDGCGNDSFIDLTGEDIRVFFIDHEIASELMNDAKDDFNWEDERLEKYSSIEEYVKFNIEVYQDI